MFQIIWKFNLIDINLQISINKPTLTIHFYHSLQILHPPHIIYITTPLPYHETNSPDNPYESILLIEHANLPFASDL